MTAARLRFTRGIVNLSRRSVDCEPPENRTVGPGCAPEPVRLFLLAAFLRPGCGTEGLSASLVPKAAGLGPWRQRTGREKQISGILRNTRSEKCHLPLGRVKTKHGQKCSPSSSGFAFQGTATKS